MRADFEKYLEKNYPDSKTTLKNYPNNLDILVGIISKRGRKEFKVSSIWKVDDADFAQRLHEYVKEQIRIGKKIILGFSRLEMKVVGAGDRITTLPLWQSIMSFLFGGKSTIQQELNHSPLSQNTALKTSPVG